MALGITQRWIVSGLAVFMADMNPCATRVSESPAAGPPPSSIAPASATGGGGWIGLTVTTSPVRGTPAVQEASVSAASPAASRARRVRPLATDGDLRRGCRLRLRLGRGGLVAARLRLGLDGRQGDGEGRALADLAADADRPAVQVHVLQRDGQAEPGAAKGPGAVHVGPVEALEDVGQVLGRDALAVVGDLAAVGDRVQGVDDLVEQAAEVDLDRLEVDHAGVEAADLQQVLQQVLEPLQLAFEQDRGALGVWR